MATPFESAQAAQAQQARGPKAPVPNISQGMRQGMANAAAARAGNPTGNQMTGMGTPDPNGGLTGIRAPGAVGGAPLPPIGPKGPPPQGNIGGVTKAGMGAQIGNALAGGAGVLGGAMGGARPPPPVSPVINQGMARAAASRAGGPPGQMTGMGAPITGGPQFGGPAKMPNTMPGYNAPGIAQDRGSFGQSFAPKAATPWGSGMFPVR